MPLKLPCHPKILIIRFSSLGDVVLSTAILPALRSTYPQGKLVFLTKKAYAEILAFSPELDDVKTLEENEFVGSLAGRIKNDKYDLIIDLHGNLRSRALCARLWLLPCVRAPNERWKRLALVWFKIHFWERIKPVVTRYAETLRALGIEAKDPLPRLSSNGDTRDVLKRLGVSDLPRPIVGFCLGSKHAAKQWPPKAAAQCLNDLQRSFPVSVVLVGKETDGFQGLFQGPSVLNLLGKTSLRELAIVMNSFSILVTMDSGPMHLAEAIGTPVISLFGPTVSDFGFGPLLPESQLIEVPLPCRPCDLHGGDHCPLGHHRCMTEISPGSVAQAVLRLLK